MRTAFLGVGNMASAIILANAQKSLAWSDIVLYDKYPEKCERFSTCGAYVADSVFDAVKKSECVFLAVKPQDYFTLLEEVKQTDGYKEKLYISIGAGIESRAVSEYFDGASVVRALPNTPMLIGRGVSVICRNESIPEEKMEFARSLFANAGSVIDIDESEMNRYVGVTSSSPAYVFKFIQAIVDGAAAQGLDTNDILSYVCDVVSGSAELLKSSGKSTDEMISMVASKGGTTERALGTLNNEKFGEAVVNAMISCTERADELGRKS